MNKYKKILNRICWVLAIGFALMNMVAFFHAYRFTHFSTQDATKTKSPEQLSSLDKIYTLLFGVNNPRPANKEKPTQYTVVKVKSNQLIDCWYWKIPTGGLSDTAKGTVILFHGYGGEKSSLLSQADEFYKLHYNVLLVDFMGSGNSEGNQTTIGFKEAADVKASFDYISTQGEKSIFLFGTSMGAVAVMKAIYDYDLAPKGIIIECPFGSLYQTTCARFNMMHAPTFPMAGLLVFWGGLQNGFWGFGHKPTAYAERIACPTLLLYGDLDKNVSRKEIDEIYMNLKGIKTLKTYVLAGHESYLQRYMGIWVDDVNRFLETTRKSE